MSRVALFSCLLMLVSLGCHQEVPDPLYDELVSKHNDIPVPEDLGPGDKIAIKVLYEEDLSGEFTISNVGTISYPLVGRMDIQGKTCLNVEDDITAALQDGYFATPSVSCSVVEYNSKQIFILGQVKAPGAFPYRANASIIEAIAMAGGFSERAQRNKILLNRSIEGAQYQVEVPVQDIIEGKKTSLKVLPGDLIFVPLTPW